MWYGVTFFEFKAIGFLILILCTILFINKWNYNNNASFYNKTPLNKVNQKGTIACRQVNIVGLHDDWWFATAKLKGVQRFPLKSSADSVRLFGGKRKLVSSTVNLALIHKNTKNKKNYKVSL